MGPYYPFEDKLAQATLIHARAKCIMCTVRFVNFRFECTLEAIYTVLYDLAFDQ